MNDRSDSWIDTALEDLAAADARVVVPAQLEGAVLREWDAHQTAGRREAIRPARWRTVAAWMLVPAAAGVIIAFALLAPDPATAPTRSLSAVDAGPVEASAVAPPRSAPVQNSGTGASTPRGVWGSARPLAMDTGYVIVPEPFSDTAALHVVRVRMARMALATLGMPIADPDAEGLVDVEMLVGDDGVARSIRNATFVRENTDRGAGR